MDSYDQIIADYDADPAFNHMRLTGIKIVPGNGLMEKGGIMFVGEAPGANETKKGIPFVGDAGEVWEDYLWKHLNLTREQVFITNVVKYRPMNPPNRDPTPYEIVSSLPYLTREINLINPAIIVPLGRVASSAFYPGHTPNKIRGKVLQRRGRTIIPIYHPAAVLYNPRIEPALVKQFQLIGEVILSY